MAEGLSNVAICERLHLSVKTVEPVVGSVFAKTCGCTSSPTPTAGCSPCWPVIRSDDVPAENS